MPLIIGDDYQLRQQMAGVDLTPPNPTSYDDEFDDESFDTSKWTWLDQGATTITENNGRLIMLLRENSNRMRGIYQTVPGSGAWTYQAKVYGPMIDTGGSSGSGLFVGRSTTQEILSVNTWNREYRGISFSTPSSSGGSWGSDTIQMADYIYYEMAWSGTVITGRYSYDGYQWATINSATPAYTPTLVGLCITNAANVLGVYSFGWFRRTA